MKYDLSMLRCLMERPMYGYELKKVIECTLITCDSTGKGFSSSMIYPSLARFEREGVIVKRVQIQEGKPNRNIYEMTEEGRRFFYRYVNQIDDKVIYDREQFYHRLACFEYLTPKSRRKLLEGRGRYLKQGTDYLREYRDEPSEIMENLHEFTLSLEELELKHIAFFKERVEAPCIVPPEEQAVIDRENGA